MNAVCRASLHCNTCNRASPLKATRNYPADVRQTVGRAADAFAILIALLKGSAGAHADQPARRSEDRRSQRLARFLFVGFRCLLGSSPVTSVQSGSNESQPEH